MIEKQDAWKAVLRKQLTDFATSDIRDLHSLLIVNDPRIIQHTLCRDDDGGQLTHFCPLCFLLARHLRPCSTGKLEDAWRKRLEADDGLALFADWFDSGVRGYVFAHLAGELEEILGEREEAGE